MAADTDAMKQWGLGAFAVLLLVGTGVKVCGAPQHPEIPVVVVQGTSSVPIAQAVSPPPIQDKTGLSAPIAAAWVKDGDVIAAGLDVPTKTIRVQRIDAKDQIRASKVAIDDVTWSTDSDLKLSAGPDGGVAIIWRGMRGGKLVRQLVILNPDLTVKTPPAEVPASACSTRDALWFADNAVATSKPWSGNPEKIALPKDKDASLLCSLHRAFAIVEEEEKTSVLPLVPDAGAPTVMMRETDFGEDDQRDMSEYNVGDDIGVVRLALSGALAIRETVNGVPGALHKLKSTIGRDDDVVAVDASSREIVIVSTQDVSATCPPSPQNPENTIVSTRVIALRIDRKTFDESVVELSPGRCGSEIGPFFTGPVVDDLSVAWVERTSGIGKARAPIVGLSHAAVGLTATPVLARIDQVADALVDAGCDSGHCWAAALVRNDENDPMSPGTVRVLRF